MKNDVMAIGRGLLIWFCLSVCLLWFFFSFNPLDIGLRATPYDHKRLMQISLVCLLTLLFFSQEYRSAVSLLFKIKLPLVLWGGSLALVVVSSALADNPLHSIFESLHWLLLASIFCGGFYLASIGKASSILMGLLVLHCLMVLKALLFLLFEVASGDSLRPALLYPGVEHHRFFNQVQVFMVTLLYIWLVRTEFKKFAYFFLFINLLLACCGGARGLLVGLFSAGTLAYLLLNPWRREIQNAALVALLAFISYVVIGFFLDTGASADVFRAHTSGRSVIWERLIESLGLSHLLLGEGAGAFSYHDFGRREGHPHNSLLQFLYEWGLLATLAAVGALLWILVIAVRTLGKGALDKASTDINAALLVSVMSAGIYSLFSGVVVMPMPQTLFFLFSGLLWGLVLGSPLLNVDPVRGAPVQSFAFGFGYRIFGGGVIVAILLVYLQLCGAYLVQQAGVPEEFRAPRFWAEGAQFRRG